MMNWQRLHMQKQRESVTRASTELGLAIDAEIEARTNDVTRTSLSEVEQATDKAFDGFDSAVGIMRQCCWKE